MLKKAIGLKHELQKNRQKDMKLMTKVNSESVSSADHANRTLRRKLGMELTLNTAVRTTTMCATLLRPPA
jgi:hypothetical protein